MQTLCEREGHDFDVRLWVDKRGHHHRTKTCHTEAMITDVDLDVVIRIMSDEKVE